MCDEPEIIETPDHLLVVPGRQLDVESGRQLFVELLAHVRRTGLGRLLVDNREAAKPLAATEKALLGMTIEGSYREYRETGGQPLSVAFLVRADFLMPFRPLADYLNGMGLAAGTFSDPGAARDWLAVSAS